MEHLAGTAFALLGFSLAWRVLSLLAVASSSYQGPHEGFRGEVTRACLRLLRSLVRRGRVTCPGCHESISKDHLTEHAINCIELRSDVAHNL